ncbi:hypothetical protein C8J57DRAFT_1239277 [Mycena rebaudengoi]|nr:hypothetical protein C8J57DRAFT_1239277 [Mycena rebaudengoi]
MAAHGRTQESARLEMDIPFGRDCSEKNLFPHILILVPSILENQVLATEERDYLVNRLAKDSAGPSKRFEMKFFWQAVTDYNKYLYCLMGLTIVIPSYSFALFIPTIIKGLGFSSAKAQLIYNYSTTSVQQNQMRGPFVLAVAVLGIVGTAQNKPLLGYVAAFLACSGTFTNAALVLTWVGSNTGGDLQRSGTNIRPMFYSYCSCCNQVVLAMVIGLGHLGGICSSFVFRAQDAPRFLPGHGTAIGRLCTTEAALFMIALFMSWNYRRLNAIKDQKLLDNKDTQAFSDMGDVSPAYTADPHSTPAQIEQQSHSFELRLSKKKKKKQHSLSPWIIFVG